MNADGNNTVDHCSSLSESGSTSKTASRPSSFATSLTSPSSGSRYVLVSPREFIYFI